MGFFGSLAGYALGGVPGAIAGGVGLDKTKKWLLGDQAAKDAANDPKNFQLQGGDMMRNYAQQQMQGAQGRPAPTAAAYQLGQAAQLNGSPQDQWRSQQMGLASQMSAVASGQQMGAGEMAVRRQAAQQAAHLAGQTNMARGANAGIMARAAARGLGDLGVNAAGAAGQSALQDQSAARAGLGSLLGQGRGQDMDMASQNAQLQQQQMLQQGQFGQQTNMANQAAALQQRGMNDQYGLGMMGQYANLSAEELRARMARAGLVGQDNGNLGNVLSAAGPIIAASDRRIKVDIADGGGDADEFMAALKPYAFRYLDNERHGYGERLGVMAQDVESSRLGRNVVVEQDYGKGLDGAAAISALLASVARLHARVAELEAERAG